MQENLSSKDIKQQTFLGIDYGAKRIGLAVKETGSNTPYPLKIIYKINELDDIIKAKHIDAFVIGMPLEPDGNEGQTAHQVHLFANRLKEKFNLPVYFMDERYSSSEAEEKLTALCISKKKQKKTLDSYAAVEILKRFLNAYCSKV